MDGDQFDAFSRTLANHSSRRRIVAACIAFATQLAGRKSTTAQATSNLPPGSACAENWQCAGAGGACRPTTDGTGFACCMLRGTYCGGDADCCGGLPCRDGICAGGLRLGLPCTSHEQCAPLDPAAGWATCRANGNDSDGAANCCLVKGSWCNYDWECCDGEKCSIVCGGAAASGLRSGSYCPPGEDLCSTHHLLGPVSPLCADNGVWDDGPTNCCFPEGGQCGGDHECCGPLACTGGFCAVAAVDVQPTAAQAQAGSTPPGGACTSDGECQQDHMSGDMVCADNGFGSDGARNCCATSGCCQSDADCCGDYRCAPAPDVCNICRLPPFPTRAPGQPCAVDFECIPEVAASHRTACVDGRCVSDLNPSPEYRPISDAEAALYAAGELSVMEARGAFDALYERMHPDAKAVVPRAAVVGWYETEFVPCGPEPTEAVKVRFVPWTWAVTGKTYPETAEVAYRQRFADGTVVRDEVRLVKDANGEWAWFFGRDRPFVEAQTSRFGGGA